MNKLRNAFVFALLLFAGLPSALAGVISTVEINDSTVNGPVLNDGDNYGSAVADIGDLDGDGVSDIAIGAVSGGAMFIHFMNTDQSIKSTVKIDENTPNGSTSFRDYGRSIASLGDLDGDGVVDIAVGAPGEDSDDGVIFIHFMNSDGSVKSTTKINNDTLNGPSIEANVAYGVSIANIGDLNDDGVIDIAVGADYYNIGSADGNGKVYIHFMNADGSIQSTVEIDENTLNGPSTEIKRYGTSVLGMGDFDGDGVEDIAVGDSSADSDTLGSSGALYIHFMNTNGSINSTAKLDVGADFEAFNWGSSLANMGDLNADGITDIAVADTNYYIGGSGGGPSGNIYIHFLNADGSIASTSIISSADLNIGTLTDMVSLGISITNVGDLDGNGLNDLFIGTSGNVVDSNYKGSVHFAFLGEFADPAVITEVTAIPTLTNDNTPNYTFNTTGSGTIAYGGSCDSADTTAVVGDNTVTFDTIADGTYSDCQIQVSDENFNGSNILTIPEFTIDTTSPTVTVEQKTGQVDPTEVDLASFTITFNEEIDSATFIASDITITGSGTVLSGPFEVSTNVYEISINGMIDDGTTSVSIPANVVSDLAGNLNTESTSTDNSVTYEIATSTSSSSGGGGGGSTTIHKVYMCKDPDGCNYVYPTGNDEDYQNYETCYKTGEGTGTECARLWALENGYVDPADYNPAVVTSDTTTSTSEAPSAVSCPAKQFNRSPERRGHGLRDRTIFRDAQPSHFAYSALMDLGEQEVVNGDDDTGYARLDDNLNRAEFVKIMTISREDQLQAGYCTERFVFPDVEYGEWYYEFVQNMQEEGIIEGYDNGYYRPGRDINFAEAYKIMAISFGYITYDEAVAQSAANDSAWYAPYKDALENAGVLPSRLERKNNSEKISRGETFLLLSEILKEVDAR